MDYYSVYITTKDTVEAKKIGTILIEMRLAACVNIIDKTQSIYRWQDEIKNEHEAILIAKTKKSAIAKIIETVKSLHSYENPCIVVWSIVDGNGEYLDWIDNQVI